ncbi:PREDICTED: uncharacterized protein LOC102107618 [Pseudopodoces humilis]|uniref:uncharacterized protein LOC102107618 n=1 Tax=Pseudopodoces humilis TaxID=181119 RepID=UPI0006B75565|nr:PREDICTED: uncharacterized protein LOC102107618 [Pseudopodoces humilis]
MAGGPGNEDFVDQSFLSDGHGAPERNNLLTCFVSFDVAEQKNPYQMMTKGGTMVGCMWACRRTRLPWLPVRRKLHPKSTKTSCQCFGESCLCAEDFDIYTAFWRAREIRAPKNPNCCKFQLRKSATWVINDFRLPAPEDKHASHS